VNIRARGVAYPYPLTGDLWVSADRDRRWRVGHVNEAAAVRGVPVAVEFELMLIPASSLLYDLPIEECADEGSHTSRAPECSTTEDGPYVAADDAVADHPDDPPTAAPLEFDW